MDEIHTKMKQWTKAIQEMKFKGLVDEIKESLLNCSTEKKDKSLSRLLTYLSRSAYACDKTKTKLGLEMFTLASFLSCNVSTIKDHKSFFCVVFHITKCLLEMKLYAEAMEIFDFIRLIDAEKLSKEDLVEHQDMYGKASIQWRATVCNVLLKNLDPRNENQVEILKKCIEYEMNALKLSTNCHCQQIFDKITLYFKQIRSIANSSKAPILEENFKAFVLAYVRSIEKPNNREDEVEIFKSICQLIAAMIASGVNEKNISTIARYTKSYFEPFRNFVKISPKCRACFKLYEHLCITLLKPAQDFTAESIKEIEACDTELKSIIQDFGFEDPVKSFVKSVFFMLSPLLDYWLEIAKKNVKYFAMKNLLVVSSKLFLRFSRAFVHCKQSSCLCGVGACRAEYDMYNSVILGFKCLRVLHPVILHTLTEELRDIVIKIAESCTGTICQMKNVECKCWMELWGHCSAYIYNIGVSCEGNHYKHSVRLHSLLCQNLIKLEGLKPTKPVMNLGDPLHDVLHRLTSVHFNHEKYEEASDVCSLNGLLSCNKEKSKAFRYWSNIKCKDSSHKSTMLEWLRNRSEKISKLAKIRLENYDQIAVCLREIKGLQESRANLSSSIIRVLETMEILDASPEDYAQGVQLLGYHLLNFQHDRTIEKYVKRAMSFYERDDNPSASFHWCYGQLQFYKFIDRLAELSAKTQSEMKSAETIATTNASETSTTGLSDIVPTYSTINLIITVELEGHLKLALQRLEEALDYDFKGILKDWETHQSLHIVTIIGEYARLYRFEMLEIRAWKLAYKLAEKLQNDVTIIYATTRCLSGLRIDTQWIEKANECVTRLTSNDRETNEIIARYKLSLANYYFTINLRKDAMEHLRQAETYMGADFISDVTNHMFRNFIAMNHLLGEDESDDHQMIYHEIIVEIFYGLLSLDASVTKVSYGNKQKQIYEFDQLFEHTNNFVERANSLLSFQEITSHLNLRLSTAQKLGSPLRCAECLKSLCYIDLSRAQLDYCEVKLQGLEHILDVSGLNLSSKREPRRSPRNKATISTSPMRFTETATSAISPPRFVDRTESAGENGASPVLRRKRYVLPEFMLHGDECQCFKCTNESYQYLVFSCTHIRAQLYTLQGNVLEAKQHFAGAMELREGITTKNKTRLENDAARNRKTIPLERQQLMLEYAMFLLDYARFLKFFYPTREAELTKFTKHALELCEVHHLVNHPIYMAVNEFILECRFEKVFTKEMYAKFTVPAIEDIDVSEYLDDDPKRSTTCSTPVRNNIVKEAKSVRRKKNPPFLKLEKVPINLIEEDDEDEQNPSISDSTPSLPKRPRRKINEQNYVNTELAKSEKKCSFPKITLTIPKDEEFPKTSKPKRSSDRGNAAADLSSIVSVSLNSVGENEQSDRSQSPEQLDKLADMIGELKVHPRTESSTKTRIRKKTQPESSSSSRSCNSKRYGESSEVINKVTELFDEMSVAKPQTSTLDAPSKSSKSRKSAKNSDCEQLKKSTLVAKDKNKITLFFDSDSDTGDSGRRSSSRLREKRSASNSKETVVVPPANVRKRAAASSTERAPLVKEVSKSTST